MKLTELQRVILHELIKGNTNAQIAAKVGYSDRNIRRKMKDLFKLFNVDSRNSLIREATIAKSRGLL